MLENAFNSLLKMKELPATLNREADTINIFVSPSNYSRSLSGPSNIEIEGDEFVISRQKLSAPFTEVKRGDRLVVDGTEFHSIKHVIKLYDLGGDIIGWRVRSG